MAKASTGTKSDKKGSGAAPQVDPFNAAADALGRGMKTAGEVTDKVFKACNELNQKFVCTSAVTSPREAVGKHAEVTVAIPPGGTGEVILTLGGSLKHYSARGKDGRKAFKRGEKVKIVDAANDTLYISL